MEQLKTGNFYGLTNTTVTLPGIVLTDTEYTCPYVDWHFHENAYFTLVLQGKVVERNHKHEYRCTAGDLLFHHSQEAHYNTKPNGYTRGFQLEITGDWFTQYDMSNNAIEGSIKLNDPRFKLAIYRIYAVTKQQELSAAAAIDAELIALFQNEFFASTTCAVNRPQWVQKLDELLNDDLNSHFLTLAELAKAVGVHPVHLSRSFSTYFGCELAQYLRLLKIHHAWSMLPNCAHSVSQVAAASAFADQSHLTRHFKSEYDLTPMACRKLFL